MNEDRLAGQVNFHINTQTHVGNPHGVKYSTQPLEAFDKTEYISQRPNTSIGHINAVSLHRQDATIGIKMHKANQLIYYGNLFAMSYIGNTNHSIKRGTIIRHDGYDEMLNNISYDRSEWVTGIYDEYTYKHLEREWKPGKN